MSQKFYSLQRVSEGKRLFISKDDMNLLTDNPEEALSFFSENHVHVWKKCNPTFTDVTMVEMLKYDDGTIKEITTVKEKIILHDKYSHDKINDDEFYREVLIYKVDGKIAYMMSVIEGDGYSRAYNMDSDTYFNPEDHEDYSDEIPKDVLDELVELACKQIESDYKEETGKEVNKL